MPSRSVSRRTSRMITRCCATGLSCTTHSMPGARVCRKRHTIGRLLVTRRLNGKEFPQWPASIRSQHGSAVWRRQRSRCPWAPPRPTGRRSIRRSAEGCRAPGGVHKYGLPRSDLQRERRRGCDQAGPGARFLGRLSAGRLDGACCMGDLVLTDTEISPVMKRLDRVRDRDHRHPQSPAAHLGPGLLHARRRARRSGQARAGLACRRSRLSATPLSQPAAPRAAPAALISTPPQSRRRWDSRAMRTAASINSAFRGRKRSRKAAWPCLPRWALPLRSTSSRPGAERPRSPGDFVLLGSEVNPVIKALREHGIEVTALHSHMIDDSPHLFFMHFWANDDAQRLAQGLRAALDLANVKRAP